jgi:hypothetical protein
MAGWYFLNKLRAVGAGGRDVPSGILRKEHLVLRSPQDTAWSGYPFRCYKLPGLPWLVDCVSISYLFIKKDGIFGGDKVL